MDCTIVICTYNRADSLQRCLESLQAAASPEAVALEVLVVANACSDHTIELLARWSEQGIGPMVPLRWVEESNPGKSYALNRAIAVTGHSKALAFVDDDHLVHREYLNALTDALSRNPNFDLYCGVIQPAWGGSEPAWVHEQGEYKIPNHAVERDRMTLNYMLKKSYQRWPKVMRQLVALPGADRRAHLAGLGFAYAGPATVRSHRQADSSAAGASGDEPGTCMANPATRSDLI